jgi:hypothetical protein
MRYSRTSSACANSEAGISIPSAAVPRGGMVRYKGVSMLGLEGAMDWKDLRSTYVIIAGLLFTIGGAVLATRGAIINKQVATELASKWTLSEEVRRSLIHQSRDARTGLIFIAIGSMLQIGGIAVQNK